MEINVTTEKLISVEQIERAVLGSVPELLEARVQSSGENQFIMRFASITETEHQSVLATIGQFASIEELRFESIGPTLGTELRDKAIVALIVTAFGIILFVAWSFRHVSKPVASWKYGLSAIIALIHDVLITTGAFALIAHFTDFKVDALFVTALLVTLGYSVNDTIVVFDRTRENLKIAMESNKKKESFAELVNRSVDSTIARSINTSVTTLLVLVALLVLGGTTIAGFITTLIIGVLIGTYSSIFLASPLLVLWAGKKGNK